MTDLMAEVREALEGQAGCHDPSHAYCASLRALLARLDGMTIVPATTLEGGDLHRYCQHLHVTLASPAGEVERLDVERLARAIEFADAHEWDLGGAPKWAAAIAKAYAALGEEAGRAK